jgi:hypothetical protein
MSKVSSKLLAAVAAGVMAASSADAQVTFSTTGTFAGPGCTITSCTFGAFTLAFVHAPSTAYLTPSTLDLGSFLTSSTPGSSSMAIPANVVFTLVIDQSSPVAGSTRTSGPITGSLAFDPSQSSLVFTPMMRFLSIDGVRYDLIIDNTGNINIAAPTRTNNPNPTIVKANVAVVPEPATVALLATGLVGVAVTGLRRRSK